MLLTSRPYKIKPINLTDAELKAVFIAAIQNQLRSPHYQVTRLVTEALYYRPDHLFLPGLAIGGPEYLWAEHLLSGVTV
jgi:hypothetical protein